MKNQKRLAGLLALGLAAAIAAPSQSVFAATKKTAAPKKTTKKAAPKATPTSAPAATAAPAPAPAPAAAAAASGPCKATGGKIVFGLEAEASDGMTPGIATWALSGHQISLSVIERLTTVNSKGQVAPGLATSWSANGTNTVWTFKLRPDIKFHNGEPFDAAAAKANIDATRSGGITALAVLNLKEVRVKDSLTIEVETRRPWVSFPIYLAGQLGAMVATEQIKAGRGGVLKPIGTGPFVFKEWVVGDHFTAVRNPSYWQKGLPCADEITFKPIPDESARIAALQAGDIDFMHTANGLKRAELLELEKKGKVRTETSDPNFDESGYVMFNNAVAPLDDKRVRKALSLAIDREEYHKARAGGQFEISSTPYPKGAAGYIANSGFSTKQDLAVATALIDEYKKEKGISGDLRIVCGTTQVQDNIESLQLLSSYWKKIGVNCSVETYEQTRYINNALGGAFQVYTWRNHGFSDPDTQRVWWHSELAPAPGAVGINFGRIRDGQIDAALDQIRESSDPVVRRKASEAIQRIFADQYYNAWIWRSKWTIGECPKCGGIAETVLPNGEKAADLIGGQSGTAFLYKAK